MQGLLQTAIATHWDTLAATATSQVRSNPGFLAPQISLSSQPFGIRSPIYLVWSLPTLKLGNVSLPPPSHLPATPHCCLGGPLGAQIITGDTLPI